MVTSNHSAAPAPLVGCSGLLGRSHADEPSAIAHRQQAKLLSHSKVVAVRKMICNLPIT